MCIRDRTCRTAGRPCVVLSTASPYKFPADVLLALGMAAPGNEFEAFAQLEQKTGSRAPQRLAELGGKPVRFDRIIGKDEIAAAALSL